MARAYHSFPLDHSARCCHAHALGVPSASPSHQHASLHASCVATRHRAWQQQPQHKQWQGMTLIDRMRLPCGSAAAHVPSVSCCSHITTTAPVSSTHLACSCSSSSSSIQVSAASSCSISSNSSSVTHPAPNRASSSSSSNSSKHPAEPRSRGSIVACCSPGTSTSSQAQLSPQHTPWQGSPLLAPHNHRRRHHVANAVRQHTVSASPLSPRSGSAGERQAAGLPHRTVSASLLSSSSESAVAHQSRGVGRPAGAAQRGGSRPRRPLQPVSALGLTTTGSQDDDGSRGHHAPVSRPKLIAMCCAVLVFGVSNRVLYRMALVPMQDYVFFLAQFQNVVYLLVYFSILYIRFRANIVTPAMLALPKTPMVLIGGCEAASQLLFMIGASHLPGVLLPLVNQTYLVWNLTFASLLLGMRYTRAQILGAFMVVVGVVTAVAPPRLFPWASRPEVLAEAALHPHAPVEAKYVAACVACFAFPALASIIKEKLFRSARRKLGGVNLDIFVVNSFASLFQALLVLLMLPLSLSYNKIALTDLPSYLHQGAHCFQGLAPVCGAPACDGAPLLPVLYVATNLCFNVSILTMIRSVGSVTTTIVGSCLVPLTMLCFTLPLPYLERAHPELNLLLGAFTLISGLLIYNLSSVRAAQAASEAQPQPPASVDELPQP